MKQIIPKIFLILVYALAFNFSFAQQSKIETLEKTLSKARNEKNDGLIITTLIKIGDSYNSSKEYRKAIKYYNKSIKISSKIKSYKNNVIAQNKIGLVYVNKQDYEKALSQFEDALVLAKTHNLTTLRNQINGNISTVRNEIIYQKIDDEELQALSKEDALELVEKEKTIRNEENSNFLKEIENLSSENQLIALKLKLKQHELGENKLEIEILNKDNELKESKITKKDAIAQKQKILIWSSFSGLLLLIALAFFIYRGYRQKQIANKLLITKNIEITDSIMYAKKIQEGILPSSELCNQILSDHFIFYKPKDIVSGDYYWVYSPHANQAIWTVADCTGHGVPGAFMNMIGSSLLNEIIIERGITSANIILDELKSSIIKALGETRDGMDAALCVWHKDTNILEFAGANNPLYIIRNDELIIVQADRRPIGYQSDNDPPFTHQEIQLETGDSIYLFTDGYADQFGGELGKKFSRKRFKKLLLSIHKKSTVEQKSILDETLENWMGENEEQLDDICIMGVKI